MARMHGKGGTVTSTVGGIALHIASWTCSRTAEFADGTELGHVNRVKDVGVKDASGSFVTYTDDTTPLAEVGQTATLVLKMSSSRTLTVKALITSAQTQVGLDGLVQTTWEWVLGGGDGSASDFVIA